ncbi:MAG TPA: SDR family oxidoreductase [Negativicutes bacterium]|jgi:NAD(P)-dependent dehydrogenase (short-subunit alcohol dehydrogenase family)
MSIKRGRVAVITGSGSGIGKAVALTLGEMGVKVAVVDVNSVAAEATVAEIVSAGGEAIAFKLDIRNKLEIQQMTEQVVNQWGTIDLLLNNAGVIQDALIKDMTEEQWDFVLNVDLKGVFLCTQAIGEVMKVQNYGRIINISSLAYLGNKGQANYSCAKAGVVAFTKVAAWEYGKFGITVNCIAPGIVESAITLGLPDKVRDRLINSTLSKRFGKTDDIVHSLLFFAAEEAGYITGQVTHVDGGSVIGVKGL